MSKPIQYSNEPLGDIKIVPDFYLHLKNWRLSNKTRKSQFHLVLRAWRTLRKLQKTSHAVPKMIRQLLDEYVAHQKVLTSSLSGHLDNTRLSLPLQLRVVKCRLAGRYLVQMVRWLHGTGTCHSTRCPRTRWMWRPSELDQQNHVLPSDRGWRCSHRPKDDRQRTVAALRKRRIRIHTINARRFFGGTHLGLSRLSLMPVRTWTSKPTKDTRRFTWW